MSKHIIKLVTLEQLKALQAISRITFANTFSADNTETDLEQYLSEAYSTDQLTSELTKATSNFYFIYVNQQIAGYLKVNWNQTQSEDYGPETLEIERIYVKPAFKRLGLGSELINQAVIVASERHKKAIWLGVWEHNQAAIKFYKKLGFKPISEHYFKLGSDKQRDIIMQKDI